MAQNIFFMRILFKLDVKLDARKFMYLFVLETLSLPCICVCALAHAYVLMCVSVPVRHLEMTDKFCQKKLF